MKINDFENAKEILEKIGWLDRDLNALREVRKHRHDISKVEFKASNLAPFFNHISIKEIPLSLQEDVLAHTDSYTNFLIYLYEKEKTKLQTKLEGL